MTQSINRQATSAVIHSFFLDGQGDGELLVDYSHIFETKAGFNWIHIRSDDTDSKNFLQRIGLGTKAIEALTADETRPRMQQLNGGVLINLRGVNTNAGSDPEDMVSVRIWFNSNLIISARRRDRKLLSIEDVRKNIEAGLGPRTTGDLISTLTEFLANRISEVVDSIDAVLTQIENDMNDHNVRKIQQKLSSVRKQTAALRRYLAPQREALAELYRSHKNLSDEDCQGLQYQADRIIHYVEDLDLARERALVLHGELQNQIAEQQNSRMYLLSIVATIFLPLSFLTGIFGMNVGGLPGIDNVEAFNWLTLSMSALAAIVLGLLWWKKWL